MNTRKFAAWVSTLCVLLITLHPQTCSATSFSYDCATCAVNWGNLGKGNENCNNEEGQSPIDINGAVDDASQPDLRFYYRSSTTLDTVDHGVNREFEAATDVDHIRLGGKIYRFLQIHMHSKSEHFINGEQFPGVAHLVHVASDGSIAVVARLLKLGTTKRKFQPLLDALGGATSVDVQLRFLLPRNKETFRYIGSTTTPGCVTNVQWLILSRPLGISQAQIDTLQGIIKGLNGGFDNIRHIQPRAGRTIWRVPQWSRQMRK